MINPWSKAIVFEDCKSEKCHKYFLKNDKNGEYVQFIKKIANTNPFELNDNSIPNGIRLNMRSVTAIEIYSRSNIKNIRKMFQRLYELARKNKDEKYRIDDPEKIVKEIIYGNTSLSFHMMYGFSIDVKDEILNNYVLSLAIIGPSLFKLEFTFFLSDDFVYHYWKTLVGQIDTKIKITKKYFTRNKYAFSASGGKKQKSIELNRMHRDVTKKIERIIKNNCPGVFSQIYKFVPCIYNYQLDDECFYKAFTNYGPVPDTKNELPSEFFSILKGHDGRSSTVYVQDSIGNIFIETGKLTFPDLCIEHKRLLKRYTGLIDDNIIWYSIVTSILTIHDNLIDEISNTYIEKTISGTSKSIRAKRKKLNQVNAVFKLITEAYDAEKEMLGSVYGIDDKKYFADIGEKSIEYFNSKEKAIENMQQSIKKRIDELKDIYNELKDEINQKTNTSIQVLVAILAIITLLQTFIRIL